MLTSECHQPAFLRASHSPWAFIPQNVLVFVRGILLAFVIATGVMILSFKLNEASNFSNWRHIYDFAIDSYFLVFLYHLITFSWTFTHLYYPHREDIDDGIESWLINLMSLPRNLASLRKQFYFTLFYTVTVVFAFMNTTIYWFITLQAEGAIGRDGDPELEPRDPPQPTPAPNNYVFRPHQKIEQTFVSKTSLADPNTPFSNIFGEGWFVAYIVLALYAIPSVLMVFEIFFLNSIKRPIWIGSHLFGLEFSAGLYLAWAGIGIYLTGWYPFFWLDEIAVGSTEAVTAYSIGFVLLAPIMYVLMQGFVGIRENLTRSRAEARAIMAAQEALEP
ncbi:hypothetical protein B0T10DRAFT_488152 [Thelonectria olida]|uniref:Uncharacterized protein n=1 Tax=Thelonectria olida TaxID=1576542 RepID=A0A9P8W5J5_9HYPO|nr:hypothetical protein B0T10DRAFT_488152 [Thelonectria olida]